MRNPYLQQLLLVTFTAGLTAWIFLQGKDGAEVLTEEDKGLEASTETKSSKEDNGASKAAFNFENYRAKALNQLNDSVKSTVKNLEKQTKKNNGADTQELIRLAAIWKQNDYPALAAYNYQKIAELKGTGPNWYRAANHYQQAQKNVKDSVLAGYLNDRAITGFQKALEFEPDHLDAKANLALAYVEGEGSIMKGVRLLKEVEEAEPEHEKALFYLGILSTRSGQYEKALNRFEKLKKLQPDNAFLHFHIGNVYTQMGDKEKAVEAFKTYKAKVEQPQLKKRAEEQIRRLKNS